MNYGYRKKLFAATLSATLLSAALTGCSAGDPPATKDGGSRGSVQVGVVFPTTDEPRWLQDQKSFEDTLRDAGFATEVLFSNGSTETERENVKALLSKGIQVLIFCAQDTTAAAASVEEAKEAGATVIAYDRLITGTDALDYFSAFDNEAIGTAQGRYLAEHAPDGDGIPLYLYAGAASDNNSFVIFDAAWRELQPGIADGRFKIANASAADALRDRPELTRKEMEAILGQVTTNWDPAAAEALAKADLASAENGDKGNVLILAPNDGTARSIADVFAADPDISGYLVTGQDCERESVQYIIDGKQSMSVFGNTRTLARDTVAMAVDILNGWKPTTESTTFNGATEVPTHTAEIQTVTRDNAEEVLVGSGYYSRSDFTWTDGSH